MKVYLTTILLCAAIVLIAYGIHTANITVMGIGGALAGTYNAIIYKKD